MCTGNVCFKLYATGGERYDWKPMLSQAVFLIYDYHVKESTGLRDGDKTLAFLFFLQLKKLPHVLCQNCTEPVGK